MYDRRMFGALSRAVTELVVPPTAAGIEAVVALRSCLDAKTSEALRHFEKEESWREDGSLSLTAWLAAHGRMSRKQAHREAVIASRLARLPITEEAWADAALSSGQVSAIVANNSSERASLIS